MTPYEQIATQITEIVSNTSPEAMITFVMIAGPTMAFLATLITAPTAVVVFLWSLTTPIEPVNDTAMQLSNDRVVEVPQIETEDL